MSDNGESRQSFIRAILEAAVHSFVLAMVIAFRGILIGRQMLEDNAGLYMY